MVETRRTVIEALNILIDTDSERISIHTFQQRPNTFAVARCFNYTGLGFSKVCYPDIWDKEKGNEIAMRKAVRELGNRIWESDLKFSSLEPIKRRVSNGQ